MLRKLFLILLYVAVFLAVDVMLAWRMHPEAKTPDVAVARSTVDLTAQAVARMMKMRTTFPKKIDDITHLEDVQAERSKVIYVMSLSANGPEFSRVMKDITQNMQKNACQREEYIKMLQVGLTVVISIHSDDGQQAAPIAISPEKCGVKNEWIQLAE